MKIAFADSTFYVALLIARDSNHSQAQAVAQSWTGSVVTTEYVLTEVANHLCGTPRRREIRRIPGRSTSGSEYQNCRIGAHRVATWSRPL